MVSLQYVYKRELSIFSVVTGLIAEVILALFFVCNAIILLCNGLNMAESKA